MSQIKISVIIPVYNSEKYLGECLDSIINQTISEIDIICVNDGSTDRSPEILAEYAAKEPRIIIVSKENGGAASARNAGYRHIRGKYTLFVDSDDTIDKTLCEKTYAEAEKDNADITYFLLENNQITPLERFLAEHPFREADFAILATEVSITQLWKSDFILKNDVKYPEGLVCEDVAFHWNALMLNPKLAFVDEKLYYYRKVATSVSHNKIVPITKIFPVWDIIEEMLKERKLFDKYAEAFFRYKFCFYYLNYHKEWDSPVKKSEVKKMLQDILKLYDFSKLDFTSVYLLPKSQNFAIHCFCKWLKDSILYGIIYRLLIIGNELRKKIKI
ncbi:MAG: glycosyltransferase [Dysgonamonadaceae bacterium]|jgi:glycosyltransferase involved in cell wall biosynthesis|nr:glycosyltransferase [Dysgonamonadaceae bacterium]